MVIVAHPDDAEFSMAGTIAAWARRGCRVIYVLCTDGNVGSHEPGMTRERLAQIRRAEQRAACEVLGVRDIVFLGHDDGQLEPTLELRRELVGVVRRYRPEVVLTTDPTTVLTDGDYINHADHRAAAQAALDAVAPACQMHLLWPEMGEPHRVQRVYVRSMGKANTWIDIGETIDLKIEALKKHVSQVGDWDPSDMIKQWAAETGKEKGMAYAEAFRVINLVRRPREEPKDSSAEQKGSE
ncbi:MAG: PIG-L family deacetylase [Chloroflexi bacterium]|nr:PIG-L family deacetylase [Chloroflexota bacterium]